MCRPDIAFISVFLTKSFARDVSDFPWRIHQSPLEIASSRQKAEYHIYFHLPTLYWDVSGVGVDIGVGFSVGFACSDDATQCYTKYERTGSNNRFG